MKVVDTGFEDLLLIEPKIFKDSRGGFFEAWKEIDYQEIGIKERFVQDNISISTKNVLRGMHGQENQGQLVTVTFGEIFDVVVDMRPESTKYKQHFAINLNHLQPKQLYMPPGFFHGFCVISDMAVINYKCTQYYNDKQEYGIIWDDPELGINWPTKNFIISEKDRNFGDTNSFRRTFKNV